MKKLGFTLIELLIVIAIIGLLSTLSVLALNQARIKSRDTKRVADVKQMMTAFEMYYNDAGAYPATPSGTAGGSIATGGVTYLKTIPTAPSTLDGSCSTSTSVYAYAQQSAGASYTLAYCLGTAVGDIPAGVSTQLRRVLNNVALSVANLSVAFMKKLGFTLIELLIVIAIIGLLSTLSVLALNQARIKSRDTKRVADVKQMMTALEMFYNDAGTYPVTATVTPGGSIATNSVTYRRDYPDCSINS